jgi:thiamine-monophosphate kinase
VEIGIGDDAAVISFPEGEQMVISCDKIPEDLIALQLGLMDPFSHGRYLATVNLSDIAAMGARPLGLLCTLAIPDTFELEYLRTFMQGFAAGGAEWSTPVVGGDTGWGSAVCFSATAFGSIQKGCALRRSGAAPGNELFATGLVGGFGTALAYFVVARKNGMSLSSDEEKWLEERLIRPKAQVDMGQTLARSGACTSCMDVTDGIGQSLRELSEASNARILVDCDALPIHPITRKVADFLRCSIETIVFGIGLDLELLGTVRDTSDAHQLDIYRFGRVVEGTPGVWLKKGGTTQELNILGWQHFKGSAIDLVRSLYPVASGQSSSGLIDGREMHQRTAKS